MHHLLLANRLTLLNVERRAIERTSPDLFSGVIECRLFESKVFNGRTILIVNQNQPRRFPTDEGLSWWGGL